MDDYILPIGPTVTLSLVGYVLPVGVVVTRSDFGGDGAGGEDEAAGRPGFMLPVGPVTVDDGI